MRRPATVDDLVTLSLVVGAPDVGHQCEPGSKTVGLLAYTYDTNHCFWHCRGCKQRWGHRTIEKFSDKDLGARFSVAVPVGDKATLRLVYVTVGKSMHTILTDDPMVGERPEWL